MKRTIFGFAVLFALLLGGCSSGSHAATSSTATIVATTTAPAATATPTVFDLPGGGQLTLDATPQRIVSLSPAATEIFCAIGAGDQLIAVDTYANCPEGSSAKPELDSFQPNVEAIAGYKPDLVFTAYDPSGLVDALKRLDIPVLYLPLPTTVAGVVDQIGLFGRITGHSDEAGQLQMSMLQGIQDLASKITDVGQGPRVYHELDNTYYTAAPQSFIGDLYHLLKAQNIAAGADQEYPQLSAEVILQRNPQVIVLADEDAGVDAASVKARAGWDVIDAVQNDRICTIDPDLVSQPGPHIVQALQALAKCLYPDRF